MTDEKPVTAEPDGAEAPSGKRLAPDARVHLQKGMTEAVFVVADVVKDMQDEYARAFVEKYGIDPEDAMVHFSIGDAMDGQEFVWIEKKDGNMACDIHAHIILSEEKKTTEAQARIEALTQLIVNIRDDFTFKGYETDEMRMLPTKDSSLRAYINRTLKEAGVEPPEPNPIEIRL